MVYDKRYLYGIINSGKYEEFGEIGVGNALAYTLPFKDIAAVVSEIGIQKIRPERKNLSSHNVVIQRITKDHSALPMAFGHISPNDTHIKNLLSNNYENFLQQLNKLNDKVEMGLKVLWDVDNIFEFFVHNHSELANFRDKVFSKSYGPTQDEKIEVGRMFESLVTHERERLIKKVTDILSTYSYEIKQNKPKHEKMVMNLAILIDKNGVERFEKGLYEAANKFDNNYSFDYSGPWAPHNFVQMSL